MTRALVCFCIGLGVLAIAAPAGADGVIEEDGYVFADGYWFKGGVAYSREKQWEKEYYTANTYNGCYCTPYQTYKWVYTWKYTKAPLPSYKSADWRLKLLDIAAARDKVEGVMRVNALEQQSFTEAVGALGLSGNFYWQGYGRNPVKGYEPGVHLSAAGVNASTVYGYSYSSVADVYGSTDLNVLYQQSARLTEGAQALAGEANTGFQGLVGQEGNNRARVAEILAKGQASSQTLKASEASPSSHTSTTVTATGVQPNVFLKLSGPATCVECHSGQKVSGGFDISKFNPATASAEVRQKVVARLVTNDPKLRMPLGKPALTAEQAMQFFLAPMSKAE